MDPEIVLKIVLLGSLAAFLTVVAIKDHRYNLLPDEFTLPLLWAGLIVNVVEIFSQLPDAVLGAAAGYIGVRLLHDLQVLFRGRAGIGLGDAKMLAALGAWFGWQSLPVLLIGAALTTLVAYARRSDKPFGVGLAAAGLLVSAHRVLPIQFG